MTALIYAVGDIHGDLEKLQAALEWVDEDARGRGHEVVFIGDLVDRRADSRGVVDFLHNGQAAERPWIVLKGNHDRMMTEFIRHGRRDPCLRSDWDWLAPQLGAAETLASYGVEIEGLVPDAIRQAALRAVPPAHLDYLEALPDHYDTPEVFFCHAGIKPGVALEDQKEDDLIWIRAPFHKVETPHPKLIVHGHTPVDRVTHYGNRINIDTGCAYGRDLSVIVLDAGAIWQVSASGRTSLHQEAP
ncbi:MAG: metallophosphoesterase family protein [Pseudomonadota bacterium]